MPVSDVDLTIFMSSIGLVSKTCTEDRCAVCIATLMAYVILVRHWTRDLESVIGHAHLFVVQIYKRKKLYFAFVK